MAIETLDDWNAILSQCCCAMPACPVPSQECESLTVTTSICGVAGADHFGQSAPAGAGSTWYLSRSITREIDHTVTGFPSEHYEQHNTRTYAYDAATGSCDWTTDSGSSGSAMCPFVGSGGTHTYSVTGSAAAGYTIQHTYNIGAVSGDPAHDWTDIETAVYSDPITDQYAHLLENAEARFASVGFSGAGLGSLCYSSVEVLQNDVDGEAVSLRWRKSRFKWVIPDTHGGTYFKITWDVVFFPETGDPSAVLTDQTWEWTGPGDPEDADTWKSDWYEIPVPAEEGENRVVNIRFECYRSTAFGNKPQVTGEAVEIPP